VFCTTRWLQRHTTSHLEHINKINFVQWRSGGWKAEACTPPGVVLRQFWGMCLMSRWMAWKLGFFLIAMACTKQEAPRLSMGKNDHIWLLANGYNGYNWGWPSARLFGWSAADWSRPATNKSISSERKRKSLLFCWERKSWTSWLLTCCSKKGWVAD